MIRLAAIAAILFAASGCTVNLLTINRYGTNHEKETESPADTKGKQLASGNVNDDPEEKSDAEISQMGKVLRTSDCNVE